MELLFDHFTKSFTEILEAALGSGERDPPLLEGVWHPYQRHRTLRLCPSRTSGIRVMTSEAIRDRIAYKPISTDRSQAEDIAELASRGHGATNGDAWLQSRAPTRVYLP